LVVVVSIGEVMTVVVSTGEDLIVVVFVVSVG
jgi:hypothetical protein